MLLLGTYLRSVKFMYPAPLQVFSLHTFNTVHRINAGTSSSKSGNISLAVTVTVSGSGGLLEMLSVGLATWSSCSTPVRSCWFVRICLRNVTLIILGGGLQGILLAVIFVSLTKLFSDCVPVLRLLTAEESNY